MDLQLHSLKYLLGGRYTVSDTAERQSEKREKRPTKGVPQARIWATHEYIDRHQKEKSIKRIKELFKNGPKIAAGDGIRRGAEALEAMVKDLVERKNLKDFKDGDEKDLYEDLIPNFKP